MVIKALAENTRYKIEAVVPEADVNHYLLKIIGNGKVVYYHDTCSYLKRIPILCRGVFIKDNKGAIKIIRQM